ncbi:MULTISPECIES: 4-hydroxy-tetrahydrodipicolinate synthase [unclassified Shewanella]|uniref:4-hydroxy-tetrahydrodipicolinate synthase n=1 Tax=unclassified Shewanella TaxID=196818 RepID=UPI000C823769|nr:MULTISPECIES: 4-hydroxy-tetrahydrodipicolinate synthase [unclassified Shewanella]MDO6620217.1 4-hydroxy-tetrahydrodipicolinate synthase [Shewanella sp. 6_MG-2023]MDO6641542.1 4-hydroxy-tetrahydrodipicolinate synthase [Shewanella sp. 5_MG-2023]PMG31710.1 4-hydroxy-tetrahydrodipicolinate synthase [Shewanella sp. 10N.286.52.C2]PMG43476.1 4-hydroxy-tetrahydrodipicolinate synthase [Shewanella sp. 10N.286.52.B9]PMH97210.1 4-hydroxy-tetrahydrodipicolinate synthase [Shewanella sp. 10N.286.48.A6]
MINGSIVALITPMNSDGTVDYKSLERLVEFHIEQGTDAIVAVGTTGESATLPIKEHAQVVSQTVKFAAGRIPVIGGNGANATAEAIELTQSMADSGIVAMLGVTPYYNKPSPKGLIAHYKAVAASTDIPQILYNVPGRTSVDMLPETVAELVAVENIIGVKEATGDLTRVARLRELCGQDFKLYSGDDATARDFLLLGGDGVISVANNIVPKAFKQLCDAALAGDHALSEKLNLPLKGLYEHLFCEANPIPVKWAAHQIGLISQGHIRLPLTELSEQFHGQLLEAMKQAQIEVTQ